MKRNLLGLIIMITVVGCGYFYSGQNLTSQNSSPEINKYYDKENPPKGIRKAMDHVMKMWTGMGEIEYSDDLYINMIREADIMKNDANPNKTVVNNPTLDWEELGPNNVGGRTRSILVDRENSNRLYAAGVTGGVYISDNGGNYWTPYAFNEEFSSLSVGRITQTVNGTFFISTSEPRHGSNSGQVGGFVPGVGIYKIEDWNAPPVHLTSTQDWEVINHLIAHPVNANQIFACLDTYQGGGVYVSNNNGDTWTAISGLGGQTAFDLRFSADNNVYATAGTKIYKSSDGGASFVQLTDPIVQQSTPTRRLVACAPSDNNIVYTVMTSGGQLTRVAKSTDAGDTWSEIAPGGTTFLDIFGQNNQAWYDACLIVDPDNKDRIFVGGVSLWSYSDDDGWIQLDNSNNNALNPYYIHADKHTFTFDPANPSILYVGTDGGIFRTNNAHADNPNFFSANFGYNVTQFYSVGASRAGRVLGGTQDNSTPYMDYSGNTLQEGQVLFGGDGTYADISDIDPNIIFLGSQNNNMARSSNGGETFSNFTDYPTTCNGSATVVANTPGQIPVAESKSHFISPFLLWENVEEYWVAEDSILASTTIQDKEAVLKKIRRANYFMGYCSVAVMSCTENSVDPLDPGGIVSFEQIANRNSDSPAPQCNSATATNPPTAFAVDKTGKYVLVAFQGGVLRRAVINWDAIDYPNGAALINDGAGGSRIQNFEEYILGLGTITASGNPAQPFEWNESVVYGTNPLSGTAPWGTGNSVYINGINFDPNDNNRAVLSVANFNTNIDKVYYCQNATSSNQTWQALPGLPAGMPVYDVILSANDINFVTNYAYAATELGVWGYNFDTNSWTEENLGIGRVRTYRIRQELLKTAGCMATYIGTHGRGIHRSVNQIEQFCDTELPRSFPGTGIDQVENASASLSVNIYPNPVVDNSKVDFDLGYSSDVSINILSIDGRVVLSENLGSLAEGKHFYNINASTLTAGNYFVNLVTDQEIVNSKFTVNK